MIEQRESVADSLAYLEKTLDNVAELRDDLTWTNAEVVAMVTDAILLLRGQTNAGA
ncbi:hypothetical protein [Microbacterium sp. LWH11-1.2]|uniref:hypothetical protein n=1 Tax=Microbacterium sp. LWH11-1.2 TaxID=3135258 RepID=UPI00313A0530